MLDSQVRENASVPYNILPFDITNVLLEEAAARVINLAGNLVSPGFIDIQINGAYGFDFSVYEGDSDAYRQGLQTVAEKIVETGVTSYASPFMYCSHVPN